MSVVVLVDGGGGIHGVANSAGNGGGYLPSVFSLDQSHEISN